MKPTFPGQRPDYFHSQEPETSNAHQAGSSSNSQGESSTEQTEPRPSESITYRQRSLQTALLAQVLARTRHQAEYFAQWNTWAQADGVSGENRTEAVNRLKAWLIADQSDESLDLSGIGLTSLPESLPEDCCVKVENNFIPEEVRNHFQAMMCAENYAGPHIITEESDDEESGYEASNYSAASDATIEELDDEARDYYLSPNITIEEPDDEVSTYYASPSIIIEEPDDEASAYYTSPSIIIEELDDEAPDYSADSDITEASNYYEVLDVSSFDTMPLRPLEDAVSDWHDEGNVNFKATWRAFAHEEGADAFSKFLDSLRKTVNYDSPEFKKNIIQWLSHLADHPDLRKASFTISVGATETCEDRVSLTYNQMKKARVTADVKDGKYDQRLDELILLSRRMFRLDALEKIAQEKFKWLERQKVAAPDEVEVYLAYQVKLREKLDLPLDIQDMAFFSCSDVTADDLATAAKNVAASEKENFIHYLSTEWKPWQSVLERLYPEHYAATEEMRYEALDSFESRVDAYLEEHGGLQNDSDARREAGVRVGKAMAYEMNDPLTRQFLAEKNLSHLLAFMNAAESVNASPFEKTRNPQLEN